MDGMLLSQYPHTDRASSQLSRDPTVRVPLNTGLRSSPPHLPSLCILSFREPGEESASCLYCRHIPFLINKFTAVPAWTESVPAATPALAGHTRPASCRRNVAWGLLLQATPWAGLC